MDVALAEEERAWRDRQETRGAAAARGGVGGKVTLDFGVGPDGGQRLLEVVDLGGGICCTGADVLHVLRVAGIDPKEGGRGIRKYARGEKERAERTGRQAEEKRARQSADREDFPRYIEGLLQLLAVQPLGPAGWGAPFESGSALVSSVGKLVPVPAETGWGGYSRDEDTGRSRQILEKVDPSSRSGVSDSGLRVIIANAGRNASRRDVFPGSFEESRGGFGTWAVLSVPYGVIEEREGELQRPDVMLGYQLAMATHVLSGSWEPWVAELKIVSSLKELTSFELVPASLTEWAAFGNEAALRDYLKEVGMNPAGPLSHVREAALMADRFANSLSSAIRSGVLNEEIWGPVLDSVNELNVARAEATSITWRKLAKERGLPSPKSPVGGGAKSALWSQYELNMDPRYITGAMARNPRQTAGESTVHNLLASTKPSALGEKKYLWGGMATGAKFIGTAMNADAVVEAALSRRGASSSAASAAGLAASALAAPVKGFLHTLRTFHNTAAYAASRAVVGKRNLETLKTNIESVRENPLVAVKGLAGATKIASPFVEDLLELGLGAGMARFADKIPAKEVAALTAKGTRKAIETVTNVSSLKATAEARESKTASNLLNWGEEKFRRTQRLIEPYLGAQGTSEPAPLHHGGSLESREDEKKPFPLRRAQGVQSLWEEEPEESESTGPEQVATPARNTFADVHKANWDQCMEDWTSPFKAKTEAAGYVVASVKAIGGTVSMQASGGEGTLLAYDPAYGRAVLAVGDMATAEYVAVLVPGMGSSLKSLPEDARRARNLRDQCLRIRPDANVAIVAWNGYKAPPALWKGNLAVITEEQAKVGAVLLKMDLDQWRLYWDQERPARQSQKLPDYPQLTISGLSYGSVVAGHAAVKGAAPDNIIFLGSPGTGLRAKHLNIPANNVFVAATDTDIVTALQWFSISPASKKYGEVTRMKADYEWKAERGILENIEKAHTSYYEPGTESLANISRVVVGKPEEVSTEEQRTGGHRNPLARLITNPPTKPTGKSRRKREAPETASRETPEVNTVKSSEYLTLGEKLANPDKPAWQQFAPGPTLGGEAIPVKWHPAEGTFELVASTLGEAKYSAAYGVRFLTPNSMDVVMENGAMVLNIRAEQNPKVWTGAHKDRVLIVELNRDGSTECYEARTKHSFGLPEAGKFFAVALIPTNAREIPRGKNQISKHHSLRKGEESDLFRLAKEFPPFLERHTTDLRLLKALMHRWQTGIDIRVPAVATKRMIDAVSKYFTAEKEATLSPENKQHLAKMRQEGPGNINARWRAFHLAEVCNIFGDVPQAAPARSGEQEKWVNSGEIYLVHVDAKGLHVEARPGSGRAFTLNDPPTAFLCLPAGSKFRWTAAGAEVKCPPPYSATSERLPLLALFNNIDNELIDIISMDNQWHPIPLNPRSFRDMEEVIAGAIVTTRTEERALPSGLKGRKLAPYPAKISADEIDQLSLTEDLFEKLAKSADLAENPKVDSNFDWRGLARGTDPMLGLARDNLKIPESSAPLARVMLKGMLETTENRGPAEVAKAVMVTADAYTSSVNRIRPFHMFEFPEKYYNGNIPHSTDVTADLQVYLKGQKEFKAVTAGFEKEWKKAASAYSVAEVDFNSKVSALNSKLDELKVKNVTDTIEVSVKSPSKALNAAFLVLTAANLGVSIIGGGLTEGGFLAHAAAAGSTTAVSMQTLELSLTMLKKTAAAAKVAKVSPFVSLFANLISLSNNLTQEEIDEWAVAFDVMGITADILAIIALFSASVAAVAGPAGVILAIPGIHYMLVNWGASLPRPDEFVKDTGEKLISAFEASLEEHRVDIHQHLESFGISQLDLAGLWRRSEKPKASKIILEHFEKQLISSSLVSEGSSLSMQNASLIASDIRKLVFPTQKPSPTPRAPWALPAPETSEILEVYVELMKYCVRKIRNTSLDKLKDLNRSSFSLAEWVSSKEAQPWVQKFKDSIYWSEGRE
ncbi:alpha/beta hydrolase [Streptomyces noursei]|uniref:alpha/beta hydrolase n=1 Tax=Streptomyces noursei TaxID=1971 RepID=UPI0015E0E1E5|nr:alpha/beta hydrolase [Streptomyces noursei]